jgi:hypothetical protein
MNMCILTRVLTSAVKECTRMRDGEVVKDSSTKFGSTFEPCSGTKPTRRRRRAFPYLAEPRFWMEGHLALLLPLSLSSLLLSISSYTGRSILRRSGVCLCRERVTAAITGHLCVHQGLSLFRAASVVCARIPGSCAEA